MPQPKNDSAYPDALVRAAEPEDFLALKALYEQPGAYSGTLQMPFPSAQRWKEKTSQPHTDSHVLVACVDDVPIGHIGLFTISNPRRRHTADIGMAIHDEFAGRGIGQLLMASVLHIADDWLNLSRLELSVYADNQRGISLYERNGFEVEGTFRNYAFRDGEYVDALAMARLRVIR